MFGHFQVPLFLQLFVCTAVRSQVDTNNLRTQIDRLTNDILGYKTFQDYIGTVTYTPDSQSNTQVRDKLKDNLYTKINKRVQAVTDLRDTIQKHFSDFDGTSSYQTCCFCCANVDPYGKRRFMKDYGFQVDLTTMCPTGQGISGNDPKHYPTGEVLQTMKDNLNAYPTLKWQYFGGEDGIMSIYPANKACDNKFDPRFRSWYSHTAFQTPKDVVLVIDRSGSMGNSYSSKGVQLMEIAKDAANTVIDTLNPDDRVSVLFFSTGVTVPNGCYSNELSQATPENKVTLKKFVSGQSAGGGTHYGQAFSRAFVPLRGPDPKYDKRERVKVILFLTDGNPTDSGYLNIIKVNNGLLDNKVVILTFAFGADIDANARTILTNIANQVEYDVTKGNITSGRFVYVDNVDNLRSSMARYYDFFSKQGITNDTTIAVPYVDAFGLGFITSICLPVHAGGQFRGVTCIDITISDLFTDATYFSQNTDSYAFIADSRARLLLHPLLPRPSSVYEDPILLHVLDIEKAKEMPAIVNEMINGTSGSRTFISKRVMSRGDSLHEGVNTISLESDYLWTPIGVGDLQLCVVLAKKDKRTTLQANRPVNAFLYHRLDIVPPPSECRYHNRVATRVSSSLKFAPLAFVSPESYLETPETSATVNMYSNYLKQNGNSAGLKSGIKDVVAVSEKFDEIVAATPDAWESAVWRYLGLREGVFRLFPGVKLVKKYDHTVRSWYRRAESQPGIITFSKPYIDAFGSGIIITLATAVLEGVSSVNNGDSPVAGVMGMDFSVGLFNSLVTKNVPECTINKCFVIDNAGYIISHPDFVGIREDNFQQIENLHITQKEKAIAKALIGNVLRKDQCINFKQFQIQSFWRVTRTQSPQSDFSLVEVPGTNVHVVVKKSDLSGSCACPINQGLEIPSCPMGGDSCECPCYSRTGVQYDPCDVEFTFDPEYGNAPVCIPPTPDIQLESLVLEEKTQRETLGSCYDTAAACRNRSNDLDCLSTAGCNWCGSYCEARSDKECSGNPNGQNIVVIIVPIVVILLVIAAIVTGVMVHKRKQKKSTRDSYREGGQSNPGAELHTRPSPTAPDYHTDPPPSYGDAIAGGEYQ